MHKNSPSSAISTKLIVLTAHHSQLRGNPPYTVQLKRCSRWAVAAKSRHFFARSTTMHRKQALPHWSAAQTPRKDSKGGTRAPGDRIQEEGDGRDPASRE